jgi:hypothetical protein
MARQIKHIRRSKKGKKFVAGKGLKPYPLTLRGDFNRWDISRDFYDEDKARKFAKKIGGVIYSGVDTNPSGSGVTYYREGSGYGFVNRLHHWWVVKSSKYKKTGMKTVKGKKPHQVIEKYLSEEIYGKDCPNCGNTMVKTEEGKYVCNYCERERKGW